MRLLHAASALVLIAGSPALAQLEKTPDKGESVETLHKEAMVEAAKEAWANAPVEEREVSSRHSIKFEGRTLKYTATAGTL